jgi:hypothetical protein
MLGPSKKPGQEKKMLNPDFRDMLSALCDQRLEVEIEGLKIPIIGRNHLLQNKRAAGRQKDIADITWLESG